MACICCFSFFANVHVPIVAIVHVVHLVHYLVMIIKTNIAVTYAGMPVKPIFCLRPARLWPLFSLAGSGCLVILSCSDGTGEAGGVGEGCRGAAKSFWSLSLPSLSDKSMSMPSSPSERACGGPSSDSALQCRCQHTSLTFSDLRKYDVNKKRERLIFIFRFLCNSDLTCQPTNGKCGGNATGKRHLLHR